MCVCMCVYLEKVCEKFSWGGVLLDCSQEFIYFNFRLFSGNHVSVVTDPTDTLQPLQLCQ